MTPKKYSQGFTLTEILVALAISAILMGGVLAIMSSSKRTYALQNELSELQENARFLMDELKREIRMAGYMGCNPPPGSVLPPFEGSEDGTTKLEDSYSNKYPPSDTLVINSFGEQLLPAATETFSGTVNTIELAPLSLLPQVNDTITINDCGKSNDYTVTQVDNTKITLDPQPAKYYTPVAIFMGENRTLYKVLVDELDKGGFALFKFECEDINTCDDVPKEDDVFLEGVENMQVRYGIDTNTPSDNIPNRYSTTPTGGPVVSVRITLLMRNLNKRIDLKEATNKNKEFQLDPDMTFCGTNANNKGKYNPQTCNGTAEHGYLHRMFTTTINVRNLW